ncbi:MAG: hypothetical protein ACK46L_17395, partial [Synechococcaceae cyanobacterium]
MDMPQARQSRQSLTLIAAKPDRVKTQCWLCSTIHIERMRQAFNVARQNSAIVSQKSKLGEPRNIDAIKIHGSTAVIWMDVYARMELKQLRKSPRRHIKEWPAPQLIQEVKR